MLVYLIGYRGTGKSTVARILAERLACDWADADALVEARAGKSIRRIFDEEGEAAFRDLESAVVADLTARGSGMVALGGGAPIREQNRAAIAASGTVVWLTADAETIQSRLAADPEGPASRPSLTSAGVLDEIAAVLAERTPIYRQLAHHQVDTVGKTAQQVADEVAALVSE